MRYRQHNSELVSSQEKIRALLLKCLFEFDISAIEVVLSKEDEMKMELKKLLEATKSSTDEDFFKYYGYFISSIFHLLKWAQVEMNAEDGSSYLKARSTHISLIDFQYFNHVPDFQESFLELCESLKSISEVKELRGVFKIIIQLPFPTISSFPVNFLPSFVENSGSDTQDEEESKIIILSIQFTIDGEPWANPQILKPEELYTIKGNVSLNEWPEGYNTLVLKPFSTSSDEWYNLSIPEISRESRKEYEIAGHVVFKYPQSTFDDLISIRLLGYFKNDIGTREYPLIIGYDQLRLKVLDPNSIYFPTGFKIMDKVVLDISTAIDNELPDLNRDERINFLCLLRGILNYQGFCLQQGQYKERDKVSENEFRDHLIQHLIGLPYIGEEISKEAQLAGGRVEIGYRGLIAELKVETSISDREELYEKYGKQPIAYASGNSKQLSILFILDITVKELPPASPLNSIKLLTPKVHGFKDKEVEHPSKLVMIILDGNTKKPSDYSR